MVRGRAIVVKAYYHARAREYDDWWLERGLYAGAPPGWSEEKAAAFAVIRDLPRKRTLDAGCGTGFLTSQLAGEVVGLDQSTAMLAIARARAPEVEFLQGDAVELPFPDASFDRVFASHFYGHLEEPERLRFLAGARRVAPELVVFDAGLHGGEERAEWQDRVLRDGSRWRVYKRFFTPEGLLNELGGGTVLHAGTWFVLVSSP
jgi:SAM-dependent methyltransferase